MLFAKAYNNLTGIKFVDALYDIIDDCDIQIDIKISTDQGEFILNIYPDLEDGTIGEVERIIDDANDKDYLVTKRLNDILIKKLSKEYSVWFRENVRGQDWFEDILNAM